MIRIMTLMENQLGARKGLTAEHGLSFLIDVDGRRILFDCGSGEGILRNMRLLGAAPASVDVMAFSHSHYDHAAGFPYLAEHGLRAEAVVGEYFFEEKYSASGDGIYTYLGCGFSEEELRASSASLHCNGGTFRLTERCALETGFPRIHPWERIPERFVKLRDGRMEADSFEDEQCLVLNLGESLVMVTGCSHPGILNMVTEIGRRYGRPVDTVLGGIHLAGAEEERILAAVEGLRAAGVRRMWCNHCTGAGAEARMASAPGIQYGHLGVGGCVFPEQFSR